MNIEFTPWVTVGTVTATPNDSLLVVGDFSMDDDYDTIWLRVTQTNPDGPWPWSFVIIGWETDEGYELGKVRAYADQAGEVFTLRTGRPPVEFDGRITLEPRSFNLQWVRNGNPLTLEVQASAGKSVPMDGGPNFGDGPTAWSWRDVGGVVLDWAFDAALAYVVPPLLPGTRNARSEKD